MTGRTWVYDHEGEQVTLSDVGPIDEGKGCDHTEDLRGCHSCFVRLPWDEQVKRADEFARNGSGMCRCCAADEVAEGGLCASCAKVRFAA